ncbi:MAG: 50S ribosomal protein L15 [bacterium (Candidatus Ratteibacteria) CG_4_10_14_3_um_filter_41_18]|uniref:Large ribosomal subunit protein uL15 n=3 Tax=Candidatus Ratteibacteria TaxID=2979319 RepID=A0A2M7EA44_9BACT|nr:MAG: 50S ribosomal protein L15 [Candidatus Omnitrophica bacterium CG1_02_41_171]PIV64616.1 MAG: 50S ribosomal protein L15 [bacterium (Candidatus Ratteibacteria) CG01_land_8_20_14_3_00_40_19]PIW32632.1 MAG: 50S ribosomal protein L15 [bacterium (Candidatus Ratteibacteria) CG15_BIG_FIL_POST_REV_8_21_14_020_41_12]PIW73969.1 MAG: 50S ribosomal protein L15 [bacterium (Candidatus Ratteibacteria) CG_4_8_14_3_um_filter_41_36]PIX77355.1 MAG: 50S ribosomal protein L15 [bacterium (Candidatus Ratteibacte
MKLNELKPSSGSHHRRKRIGRGPGSGHGKTATRGHKGQKSRTGVAFSRSFEGGQTPSIRKIPKRGFKPIKRKKREYEIVNLEQLNRFDDGETVDKTKMRKAGLVKKKNLVKVLARGDLKKKLTIKADKFSKKAIEVISKIGGKTETTS